MSRVCVIGLGKLGAVMAAVFAEAGHDVVGVDVNRDTVIKVQAGLAPVDEPGLQNLIDKNTDRLTATTDLNKAIADTDIAFIIVPTNSKPDGFFDHSLVLEAAIDIGDAVRRHDIDRYNLVVSSTVMPGTCQNAIQPAIDGAAGRHVPVCYSPEFIALGSVINDMRNPDIVLIGADDETVIRPFCDVMDAVVTVASDYRHLSLIDAELAKISVNSYVTMKISFANQLAAICEGIPGADARRVLHAIGGDTRIGRKYLHPGGPYGGPCFPRDNRAFQAMATRAFAPAPLAEAADLVNDRVVLRIMDMVPTIGTIGILGLTYKVDTAVTTESLGTKLGVLFPAAQLLDPTSTTGSPQQLVNQCDHVIIATPWPEYADLDYSHNTTVVDVWGIVPSADNIMRLGRGT